jgi:hypothetical protein
MELIKVGDLVSTRTSYHPPKMIYGNITEIKDSNGEIHEKYEVITGHGDENSKLKVIVSYFAELDEDYHYDITDGIKYFETPLVKKETNMHNLVFHTDKKIKGTFKHYRNKIDKINNKIDFLKKHRNIIEQREEKLVNLLDVESNLTDVS